MMSFSSAHQQDGSESLHLSVVPVTPPTAPRRRVRNQQARTVEHGRSQSIAPDKLKSRNIRDFMELVETVARVEASRLPRHLITHEEIVNIGALTLHLMFTKDPEKDYNVTYLSTAIKWAVRNELRYRYKWYGITKTADASEEESYSESAAETDGFEEAPLAPDRSQVREAIYESILSVDGMMEADNPHELRDERSTPEEVGEQSNVASIVRSCLLKLPNRDRELLEARFFQHKRMREIGIEFNISPSRASRVVQSALDKIKKELISFGIDGL